MEIKRASGADLQAIIGILADAALLPISKGIEQWPASFSENCILEMLEKGDCYLVFDGGEAIATFTVLLADPCYWHEPYRMSAYVYKLGIRKSHRGRGLAAQIFRWIDVEAVGRGLELVRLDVKADNPGLRAHYESLGFRHVGDVRVSAFFVSLYERRVSVPRGW